MSTIAICIGRFQPFHNGHLGLLSEALASSDHLVVGLGSAYRARTPLNPFLWEERCEMISGALSSEDSQRTSFVPLRDYFNSKRWSKNTLHLLRESVARLSNGCRSKVVIYWNSSAASDDDCCCLPADWEWGPSVRHGDFDGTEIRNRLFNPMPDQFSVADSKETASRRLKQVSDDLPPEVSVWLQQYFFADDCRQLCREWQTLTQIRQSWRSAPFPPSFVTVDAVVRCGESVLLVRRGRAPGQGLLALPGGFVDQQETVGQAVVRELYEETTISVNRTELWQSLSGRQVFDHPMRSQYGRVITHAHFFDLDSQKLPGIKAGDDACHAMWVPIAKLCSLEDHFHDDHFFILDHFLGILPPEAATT